jgi:hypothetical protein
MSLTAASVWKNCSGLFGTAPCRTRDNLLDFTVLIVCKVVMLGKDYDNKYHFFPFGFVHGKYFDKLLIYNNN